jgi:hypothetical protein
VKCQILDPYVEKGILRGAVCPWEIGVKEPVGYSILEDFHDTLEAIWVWSYYTSISKQPTYIPNIKAGWDYVTQNFERFIPPDQESEGFYDCAQLLAAVTQYETAFSDLAYRRWAEPAGERLTQYIPNLRPARGREYSDPWWMTTCLAAAAKLLRVEDWWNAAKRFVRRTILNKKKPFKLIEKEPRHRGPGGHDFFSQNATKVLALIASAPWDGLEEFILDHFLPVTPSQFIQRHTDENAWNASVAMALGESYMLTQNPTFLERYFAIMDELKQRDWQQSAALPRAELFPIRESWVTFFYAKAYAAIIKK